MTSSNTGAGGTNRHEKGSPPDLRAIAHRLMLDLGFLPDFPPQVLAEAHRVPRPTLDLRSPRDLRFLLWSSIDNAESRDLDQIEVAERLTGGETRVRVAIADVDVYVPRGGPTDVHARRNTASIYTGVVTFPMLPDSLSNHETSLLEGEDRLAVVIDMVVDDDGTMVSSDIYPAVVHNYAKLVYEEVSDWLGHLGPVPERVGGVDGLAEQVRLQDEVAQKMRAVRYRHGALDLETIEARPVLRDEARGNDADGPRGPKVIGLQVTEKNRARELVEDLMIAANGATARFLASRNRATIRRVVRSPERWQRIVDLASGLGVPLPSQPNPVALAGFLQQRKAAAPDKFPDLSLAIVKLMGPGEYALDPPGIGVPAHFGLAVSDYTHATAPNRRYPDLVTQRVLMAAAAGLPPPYGDDELAEIARHCTERENAARKVERQMRKVIAATLLADRIGEHFEAVVTGVTPKGTFARLVTPPAEGRIVRGEQGLDVGDKIPVRLVATEPTRGFIDFARLDERETEPNRSSGET